MLFQHCSPRICNSDTGGNWGGGGVCLVEGFAFNSFCGRRSSGDCVLLEVLRRNLVSMKSETWEFILHLRNGCFVTVSLQGRVQPSPPCTWSWDSVTGSKVAWEAGRRPSKNSWNQCVFWVEGLVSAWTRGVGKGWGSRENFWEAGIGAAATLKDS